MNGTLLGRVTPWFAAGRFGRHVGLVAGGTALGQAIILLAAPVLTRLYAPSDFGAFAVYSSLLFTFAVVVSLRFDLAILLPADDGEAASVLRLSRRAAMVMALLVGGLLAAAAPWIAEVTDTPAVAHGLWMLPLGLWGAGSFQALNAWTLRRRAFRSTAAGQVSQAGGRAGSQIAFGFGGLGLGLLAGDALGRAIGAVTLTWHATRGGPQVRAPKPTLPMRVVASKYRRFPLLSSWAALVSQAGFQAPAFLLAALYGPKVAGWYALGQRVVAMPTVLLGSSIAQVYLQRAAALARTDARKVRRLFFRAAGLLLVVGVLPFGILALAGPRLFGFVFGPGWEETGRFLQVLSGMLLVQFVVVPLSQTLHLLQRQGLQLAWDVSRLLVVVGTLVFGARAGWGPERTLALYAGCVSAAYVVLFLLMPMAATEEDVLAGRTP
jgi:O-antigen/teichoic acid export membrane protein